MPMENFAPFPHSELGEAIWTLQEPSNVAALADLANGTAKRNARTTKRTHDHNWTRTMMASSQRPGSDEAELNWFQSR